MKKTTCGACQIGKQTKASHHKVNVIATSRCLELLHVDLMGPTRTKSLGGKRYLMVILYKEWNQKGIFSPQNSSTKCSGRKKESSDSRNCKSYAIK